MRLSKHMLRVHKMKIDLKSNQLEKVFNLFRSMIPKAHSECRCLSLSLQKMLRKMAAEELFQLFESAQGNAVNASTGPSGSGIPATARAPMPTISLGNHKFLYKSPQGKLKIIPSCEQCGVKFIRSRTYSKHMRKVHKMEAQVNPCFKLKEKVINPAPIKHYFQTSFNSSVYLISCRNSCHSLPGLN